MSKKIVNEIDNIIPEMLEGFVTAHKRYYKKAEDANGIILKGRRKDKVSLVVGGGSGHKPLFSGFVGKGLADAAVCGNIFTSPDPGNITKVASQVDNGKGVLFIYGNYAGDNMNFDMAEELLEEFGIKATHVRVQDDCASAPLDRVDDRRGIAGDVFVMKIAGAACDSDIGDNLEEVVRITEKARDNTRSMGLATSPGQIPGNEKPTFYLADDEIEYGMGIHGEPGIERTKMQPADVLTEKVVNKLLEDMPLKAGSEIAVLINGLGSTTILEMSIVYRKVAQMLEEKGIIVHDADINSYCTCMEMGGFSVSFLKLDAELKKYYDMHCYTPYYSKECR